MSIISKDVAEKALRHGEVLLVPVSEIPTDFVEDVTAREVIIARSETHHHHIAVADAPMTLYRPKGADSPDLYLKVTSPARVEHQKEFDKHQTLDLPEGLYLVRPKNEYDLFADLIQQVRD